MSKSRRVSTPATPEATVERAAPVPPVIHVQVKEVDESAQKKRRSRKNKFARELGNLYGLPADLFVHEDESNTTQLLQEIQQGYKRGRERVAEDEANAARDNAAPIVAVPVAATPEIADNQQNKKQDIKPEPILVKDDMDFLQEIYDSSDFFTLQNLPIDLAEMQFILPSEPSSPTKPVVVDDADKPALLPVRSFEELLQEEMAFTAVLPNEDDDASYDIQEMEIGDEEEHKIALESLQPIVELHSNGSLAELLDREYPVVETSDNVPYPIHFAVKDGDLDKVKAILEAKPTSVLLTDERGQTPHQIAVALGFTEIAEMLYHADKHVILELIAGLDLRNEDKEAPAAPEKKATKGELKDKVKVHSHSMFTRKRSTRNSAKAVATDEVEQDSRLQVVQEGLAKAAELQLAAKEALNSAMHQLEEVQKETTRSYRKRK